MKKALALLLVIVTLCILVACHVRPDSDGVTTTIHSAPVTEGSVGSTTGVMLETLPSLPEITVEVIEREEPEEDVVEDATFAEDATDPTDEVEPTQPEQPTEPSVETPTEAPAEAPTTTQKPTTTTTQKPTTTTTQKPTTTTTQKPTTTTQKPTTTTTQKPTTTTTTKPTNPTYAYTTNQKHTALHYTQRYHYNLLDKPLQEVYDLIVKAVNNLDARTETFVLDEKYTDSFRKVFTAFYLDNPEYFYVARHCGVVNYSSTKHRFEFLYSVANYDEDPSGSNQLFEGDLSEELKSRIRAKKAAFDKEVQSIISTIPANAPAVVKEQMAYESILKACRYNMTAVTDYLWDGRCDDNWTAYGIMVNKKGVCESYSEAFQTLCLQMGIHCITITGTTSGGGHMWNAVRLDDGWYMCDITFDDPIGGGAGRAQYRYFNRTSLWMQENSNHVWQFSNDFTIPKCTKTTYAYENYFGGSVWGG